MWGVPLHYWWWVLALVLIAGEVLAPGFFLLWIGIAAAVMGIVTWVAPGLGAIAQAVLFVILAFASCLSYWRFIRARLARGDDPVAATLSRRGEQMVGQRYVLIEAIVNGRGKARVGDGQWLVAGPDLPAGAEVEVVGVDGALLKVRAAVP
ncbi:MAG: Putative activity regulator of membrane protease YbbK [Rhodanobacteraceae bacterium]|jgi:membrane protein implicated in regulation of membrane protease activity|nr:MAG: Putative activity regulator of membrane protease YbbK [Rhodanobacteraceae bacterium]